MDRNSGRVFPQYHVKLDMAFDTVKNQPLGCTWMNKAGFIQSLPTTSSTENKPSPSKQPASIVSDLTVESLIVDNLHASYDPLIQTMVVEDQNTEMLQNEMDDDDPKIAMKAQSDPDTMYHHQAMKESDHQHFTAVMDKEITDQMANGNFILLPKSSLPKGATVLNAVWQMKRKRGSELAGLLNTKPV